VNLIITQFQTAGTQCEIEIIYKQEILVEALKEEVVFSQTLRMKYLNLTEIYTYKGVIFSMVTEK